MSGAKPMVRLFGPSVGWDEAASAGEVITSQRELCARLQGIQRYKPTREQAAFATPFELWVERRDERLRLQYGTVIPRKLRRDSAKALRREWLGFLEGRKALIDEWPALGKAIEKT